MAGMRVGVIDVGANTLRLLVAERNAGGLDVIHRERVQLGLGDYVEQSGKIPRERLAEARRIANGQAASARRLDCARLEVVVTSPGRQAANADELVASLSRVRGATVRVLSAEDEASFAFRGALASVDEPAECVAVCDVGGGSTQIAIGSPEEGPVWIRSLDIGSLRLTRRALSGEPPSTKALSRARDEVAPLFTDLTPPFPQAAYATGGSARNLAKLVGPQLGAEELAVAMHILAERPSRRLAKTFDISPSRARTLPAGALLLACAQRLLGVPLVVTRTGLREGVALSLLAAAAVAA